MRLQYFYIIFKTDNNLICDWYLWTNPNNWLYLLIRLTIKWNLSKVRLLKMFSTKICMKKCWANIVLNIIHLVWKFWLIYFLFVIIKFFFFILLLLYWLRGYNQVNNCAPVVSSFAIWRKLEKPSAARYFSTALQTL